MLFIAIKRRKNPKIFFKIRGETVERNIEVKIAPVIIKIRKSIAILLIRPFKK